ncbi:uncharacterized protein [Euphorbia lathyris]|uniref:uncharacterized protein n=1 Tax=Euphorbia lathyris TaxID=212925 RepID=UPI0033141417
MESFEENVEELLDSDEKSNVGKGLYVSFLGEEQEDEPMGEGSDGGAPLKGCRLRFLQPQFLVIKEPKMFHFIRELNMIYDNQDKGIRPMEKKLNLNKFGVHSSFNSSNKTQELKEIKEKQRGKSDSYNDWHNLLQERSTYPTPSINKVVPIYEVPEMITFVVDSKHHLKDVNVVLSQLDDCALEKYTFSTDSDSDSESIDSTKETLERLSYLANEYKLKYDSESCDSTKETLERLSCIANELKLGSENENDDNDEEDFDVENIFARIEEWIENDPVEKIIHTVEDCQSETIKRSVSEIQGSIPNSRTSSVSVPMPRRRNASEGSIQSTASGASFAFPILGGEVTQTPQVIGGGSVNKKQIVAANRKHVQWYPRWRVLACFRAI